MKPETFSTVLAFLIMSALFSPGQTPSGAETGIEGVITISPTQAGPVRDDSPASRPLANAAFAVENEKGALPYEIWQYNNHLIKSLIAVYSMKMLGQS